jgi:hypothetical protein
MSGSLRDKLLCDYKAEEEKAKKKARGTLSSFLGIDEEQIAVITAGPDDKGIRVHLIIKEDEEVYQFYYQHPSAKIDFAMDGNIYPVENRAEVGRIITIQEFKHKR